MASILAMFDYQRMSASFSLVFRTYGGFLKIGYPWVVHVKGIFHHKPSSYCMILRSTYVGFSARISSRKMRRFSWVFQEWIFERGWSPQLSPSKETSQHVPTIPTHASDLMWPAGCGCSEECLGHRCGHLRGTDGKDGFLNWGGFNIIGVWFC